MQLSWIITHKLDKMGTDDQTRIEGWIYSTNKTDYIKIQIKVTPQS